MSDLISRSELLKRLATEPKYALKHCLEEQLKESGAK